MDSRPKQTMRSRFVVLASVSLPSELIDHLVSVPTTSTCSTISHGSGMKLDMFSWIRISNAPPLISKAVGSISSSIAPPATDAGLMSVATLPSTAEASTATLLRPRFPPWRPPCSPPAASDQAATAVSAAAAAGAVGTSWLQSVLHNGGSGGGLATPKNVVTTSAEGVLLDESGSLCVEVSGKGLRRVYRPLNTASSTDNSSPGFQILEERQTPSGQIRSMVQSYLLPQGFPESVAPQYASYMFWRGVQYFFGGAISVFTTTSLMGALGVAGKYGAEASAAINWVIKDGAGRLGRLLFARWGRELDCELKQFRLFGDLLMEGGAALELATIFAPGSFLPLACTANLAKNLAAVAASSTRAPIYRTFALSNNLADVTAKGESVANLADIVGTVFGIGLSKARLPLVPTFCFLSAGYLIASRKEVDSVELPYLNRARLALAMQTFLEAGRMPTISEANAGEWLLPWGGYHQGLIELGASVDQAASTPSHLRQAAELYSKERYIVTYRQDTGRAYVVLKAGATTEDYLAGAFRAHVILHLAGLGRSVKNGEGGGGESGTSPMAASGSTSPMAAAGSTSPMAASGPLSSSQRITTEVGSTSREQFRKQGRRGIGMSKECVPSSFSSGVEEDGPSCSFSSCHEEPQSSKVASCGALSEGADAVEIPGNAVRSLIYHYARLAAAGGVEGVGDISASVSLNNDDNEDGSLRKRLEASLSSRHAVEPSTSDQDKKSHRKSRDRIIEAREVPTLLTSSARRVGSYVSTSDLKAPDSTIETCSYILASELLPVFLEEARSLGWRLQQTMLNPQETRLVDMHVEALET